MRASERFDESDGCGSWAEGRPRNNIIERMGKTSQKDTERSQFGYGGRSIVDGSWSQVASSMLGCWNLLFRFYAIATSLSIRTLVMDEEREPNLELSRRRKFSSEVREAYSTSTCWSHLWM
jgi:hypothetical protein